MAIADVTPGEKKLMTAIDDLVHAYKALIAATDDEQEAFEAATRLERHLAGLVVEVGGVRSSAVVAIRDKHALSLAELALLIGVSKTRAAALVNKAAGAAGDATPPEREQAP